MYCGLLTGGRVRVVVMVMDLCFSVEMWLEVPQKASKSFNKVKNELSVQTLINFKCLEFNLVDGSLNGFIHTNRNTKL